MNDLPGTILYHKKGNRTCEVRGTVDGLTVIRVSDEMGSFDYELLEPDDIGPKGTFNYIPASVGPWEQILLPSGAFGWVRKPTAWPEILPSDGYIVAPATNVEGDLRWYGNLTLDNYSSAEDCMAKMDELLQHRGLLR